ncbi:hypothetical protein, partial [Leptospira noguchii]|uniref:hypothetical protein n=1 Tax=Leptospira noguchii TaxID=28182 RepID=UPI001E3F7917
PRILVVKPCFNTKYWELYYIVLSSIIELLKNESLSASVLWKRPIEVVLLITTMEFFNNSYAKGIDE